RLVHAGLALISLRSTSRPPRPPARFAGVDPAPLAAFAPGTWGPPPRIRGATLARRLVHAGLALISLRSTSRPPRPPARFAGVDPAPLAAFAPGTWGPPPRIRGATLARRVVHPGLALISLRSTSRPPRPPARFAGVDPAPLAAFAPGTWGPPPRPRSLRSWCQSGLLVPEGLHRIEAGSAQGGDEPAEDPAQDQDPGRGRHRGGGQERVDAAPARRVFEEGTRDRQRADGRDRQGRDEDAEGSSDQREDHR